ncbi:MAG: polysaccharide deacetylase family protein [Acidobacteriota bacterium]
MARRKKKLYQPPAVGPALRKPHRWRPTPFVAASIALHAAALPWAVATSDRGLRRRRLRRAAALVGYNNLALVVATGLPFSDLLGPSLRRLPAAAAIRGEVALTFDDGPDPHVTPRVLDLLDHHGACATFFCIARCALRHPDLVREIVSRGHRVENHTTSHPVNFSIHFPRALRREIGSAQDVLGEITGRAPTWFRAPAGMRNPFLDPMLARLGLHHAGWTRRGFDTVDGHPHRVGARLLRGLQGGEILLLHDGNAARTAIEEPVTPLVLSQLLQAFDARGLRAVALPDPSEILSRKAAAANGPR